MSHPGGSLVPHWSCLTPGKACFRLQDSRWFPGVLRQESESGTSLLCLVGTRFQGSRSHEVNKWCLIYGSIGIIKQVLSDMLWGKILHAQDLNLHSVLFAPDSVKSLRFRFICVVCQVLFWAPHLTQSIVPCVPV